MRDHPQVQDFISYYLSQVNDAIVDVGYFAAPNEALAKAGNHWLRATDASEMPAANPADVFGELTAAGSSTVYPLTKRIAEQFVSDGYLPLMTVARGHPRSVHDSAASRRRFRGV